MISHLSEDLAAEPYYYQRGKIQDRR
jgi:hypothetical protein